MTDFNNMLKQAQELQAKMVEAQKKVEDLEAEGSAGGGLVKVTVDGKNMVKNVFIDPSLLVVDEVDILEDLVLAAHNDAKDKVQKQTADAMSSITGGLKMPPGFKMPI
ncbi:MAG: YbaB/EbfC family nucleoid-associated protein [Candidatus Pelagibacterales bacterium]|jgi:DNA-binding YbaB/EbfC family protein|tara:strand:+ start:1163 stop:1486 length:324 start_codon:yes stop_codon:yes gene_type:complete